MAIINLVATSVPELSKSQITVVDQKGTLLSDQAENSELTMAGKQFDYSRRMEGMLTQRVQNILQPILGNDRYKAEVSAVVDFSAVESTAESFNPTSLPCAASSRSMNNVPAAQARAAFGCAEQPATRPGDGSADCWRWCRRCCRPHRRASHCWMPMVSRSWTRPPVSPRWRHTPPTSACSRPRTSSWTVRSVTPSSSRAV